jgi:vancomycin resistance protein VanW
MAMNPIIPKPQQRSLLRKRLGREYFIFKRKLHWIFGEERYAKINSQIQLEHRIIQHQSILLRPLKEVEMYLQQNKVTNLTIAIKHIHQVVIGPGETFSIWKMVGRPTKGKGYLTGMALHNGKIEKDIGGGLCQLGNLIYWMALHTPLAIKERWRHGYDVFPDINRSIPFACGATLAYNYIDLQLTNPTNHIFQIHLWMDKDYLHGAIYCNNEPEERYEIFETDHHFAHQWWGGYTRHNKIWKKIINLKTNDVKEELVSENNAIMMYNPLIE